MSLSDRIRPNCEAAPWVVEEVKKLERDNAALREALEWIAKRGWDPEGTTIDNANLAYESCCEARAAIDAARKEQP